MDANETQETKQAEEPKYEIRSWYTGDVILSLTLNHLIGADLRGANLRGADLRGANLRGASLRGASLRGADLTDASLRGADLTDANLTGANLRGADLTDANLRGADLRGASLTGADLTGANLTGANLRGADLTDASLRGADLTDANLTGANLTGADLTDADLRDANLRGADLTDASLTGARGLRHRVCPEKGSFIGFKKAQGHTIELEITEDAQRITAIRSRKCRASKVKVISFTDTDGNPADVPELRSQHDSTFVYRVGETVEPDSFDDDPRNECSNGIHFFITRQEAIEW